MPIDELLPIGALATRTGLAISAIRFYESRGLVRSTRNSSGHRRFLRSAIRRLSFIKLSQELGFSLEDIHRELSDLPEGRTPTKADWSRIARSFRRKLNERIAKMERLRDRLDGCIGCGCLSLKKCGIYNIGDWAGDEGPGALFVEQDVPRSPT